MSNISEINKDIIPKVFIILLNYNGWKDTIECLQSLLNINYQNYQIVIVDNKSINNSVDTIKNWIENQESKKIYCLEYSKKTAENGDLEESEKYFKKFKSNEKIVLINSDENLGFSGGNNIGIKYALNLDADYIMLLNNDTVVEADFLMPLVDSLNKNKEVGIVGGKIFDYYNPQNYIAGGYIDYIKGSGYHYYNKQTIRPEKVTFLSGCLWLIRKDVFKKVGYLDEKFFMYLEDVEFCCRVLGGGYLLQYNPDSIIYHKEGRSTNNNKPLVTYYNTRNRLYFVKKCYQSRLKKMLFYIFFITSRILKMLINKETKKYIKHAFADYKNSKFGCYKHV
ncbi:glycosyltransferase family 2 protein [Clostridium estertheticum]|uniref:glycosyltransferase family 2 protein n=1 Tax=Clostridium estertheticum TaxID=238834 RepID=UPI001C0BF52A|nr:glycosyltransferase family 2 protein [Clostridium estertheticum]MBU3183954.1 glycosyltransferase family 2 protein [Clostridium estertheticum]